MCPDGPKARLRISAAFPAKPLRPPVTCFRRKRIYSTITAIELRVPAAFAAVPAAKHVQELHLIPLFSRTRMRVRPGVPERVAHLPQKPHAVFSFGHFLPDRESSDTYGRDRSYLHQIIAPQSS